MSGLESLRSFVIPNRPVAWFITPLAAALMILENDIPALTLVTPFTVALGFWAMGRSALVARAVRIPRRRWLSGAALLSAAAAVVPAAVFAAWAHLRMGRGAGPSSPYVATGQDTTRAEVVLLTFAVVAVVLFASAWTGIALGTIQARHGLLAAAATLVGCFAGFVAFTMLVPESLNPGAHIAAPVPGVFVFLLPLAAAGFLIAAVQLRRAG